MSANWYTFKCYCANENTAKKLYQALLPLEDENYGSAVRRLASFPGKSGLTESDLSEMYLEDLNQSETSIELQLQGSPSSLLSKSLTQALTNAGADLLVIDIFYDQVGESEKYYFKNGKSVEYEEIEDELALVNPVCEIEQAMDDDDENKAILLLENGLDPDLLIDDTPLLMQAIQYDMFDLALAALDAGATLPEDEELIDDLINLALESDHLQLISRLMEKGLDFTSGEESPYCLIDYQSNTAAAITRLLIKKGIDVNTVDEEGSILWKIQAPGPIARIFTKAGAKLVVPDDAYSGEYQLDLMTAIAHNHLEKIKQLWDVDKIKKLDRSGLIETCLVHDRVQVLKAVLGKSINPFLPIENDTDDENTLIAKAVGYTAVDCLSLLIKHVPENLNQQQQEIIRESYAALSSDDARQDIVDQLEILLSRLPLLTRVAVAIQKDDVTALTTLVPHVDPSSPEQGEYIPFLHQTIQWDAIQCMKFLLEQSVDLEETDRNENTALGYAISQGNTDMAVMLLKAGSNPDTLIHPSREDLNEQAAEEQLAELLFNAAAGSSQKGKKTMGVMKSILGSMQDKYGTLKPAGNAPAIVIAAYHEDEEVISLLLDAKAELDQTDEQGRTALMMLISAENGKLTEMLLVAGAQTDIKDNNGKSAMQVAKTRDKDLVRLLKKHSKKKGVFKIF
ncbi:MAG TPA: ankyrin repeat domain-containing protein [Crenotrichaceae bacterium]|nr:ankyrin repeat domain-containing protein [Crenotrichaceae bacterium]